MEPATGLQALATLKPLFDLGRQISDANNVEKLRALAGEALEHAVNARSQTALLQDQRDVAVMELNALKAEIEKANRFEAEAENYIRERTPSGATVYREKDPTGIEADSPYFCPNCFANKRVAIMNPSGDQKGQAYHSPLHDCSYCKHSTPLPRLRPTGH